ncbi:efflux RND transporter periplasmic adaptor subunit [Proteiniphilum sp. X52]|uniref:efflux RND transporter periplasmic adaptor subunit n=1 Tax=Proteiniphilum sp. X52 TaxID=2382159 RepID=UPI000F0A90DF|nr:efflux RND transporter periplasmic adaptor subunit [Proteiniphilum sp. X52]RNC63994.1 efflux RND transporter periplasmic adaptor subunit [Proteiniphilum sp. X52]
MSHTIKKNGYFISSALLIMLFSTACGERSKNDAHTLSARIYPVRELTKQTAMLESVFPVTLRGEEDAEIKPRVNGYIDKVYIEEGAVVKKGQALFSINSPTSEHDLASAKAAVESANANLNTARLNVERIRPLAQKNIVSGVQLQTYENAYTAAQAAYSEAQVALKAAQATSGWTTVTSPIDGIAGSIPYRSGNMVTNATTLTTISKTHTTYAYFSLNEKALSSLFGTLEGETQAEKINNIPEATLLLADGSIYPEKGKITAISGIVNSQTGAVSLRATFPNKHGTLRSGASGRISIPRELDDVFVIPQKATFTQQDKVVLYKVVKDSANENDSTVQTIISVLPLPDGKHYAVTSGLSEGDRIVVDGIATLGNARKIKTAQQ